MAKLSNTHLGFTRILAEIYKIAYIKILPFHHLNVKDVTITCVHCQILVINNSCYKKEVKIINNSKIWL